LRQGLNAHPKKLAELEICGKHFAPHCYQLIKDPLQTMGRMCRVFQHDPGLLVTYGAAYIAETNSETMAEILVV
jgi:hypothetical protein